MKNKVARQGYRPWTLTAQSKVSKKACILQQWGAQNAHGTPLPKTVLKYNVDFFLIILCVI